MHTKKAMHVCFSHFILGTELSQLYLTNRDVSKGKRRAERDEPCGREETGGYDTSLYRQTDRHTVDKQIYGPNDGADALQLAPGRR